MPSTFCPMIADTIVKIMVSPTEDQNAGSVKARVKLANPTNWVAAPGR